MMKLLLTSNGLCNQKIENALKGMLDKPVGECNFVFIPTAANASLGDKTWLVNDLHNAHSLGWKDFQILDIAVAGNWDKKLWWPLIEKADVVLVGGGNAGYLSYWLQKSGLMDALPELLKTKVYIGISAGSMVATAGVHVSSAALKNAVDPYEFPLDHPNVPDGESSRKSLGFVDFLFRPHWGRDSEVAIGKSAMRKAYDIIKKPIYLADDQTAIKIVDGEVQVITEGRWMLIGDPEE